MTDVNATDHSNNGAFLIPRRDFLIVGSAAAVGALANTAIANLSAPVLPALDSEPLSVGYVAASLETLCSGEEGCSLVSAGRLGTANGLGDAVRVRVQGIVRAARNGAGVELDAVYRVADAGHREVPFFAWSDHALAARGRSSAASFVVPVGSDSPLTLMLTSRPKSTLMATLGRRFLGMQPPAVEMRALATLHRAGVYFIAVPGPAAPNWASIRAVAPTSGKLPRLEQVSVFGKKPVSFDYIVVGTEQV